MDQTARSRTVIVFDVNETLLDLQGLRGPVESVLGPGLMPWWFTKMLHRTLVTSIAGVYVPFDEIGVDALIAIGASRGVDIPVEKARSVVAGLDRLAPHPDVVPALELLGDAGFRLATLTNSSLEVLERQMLNSGLEPYFEQKISVEEVGVFKPFAETYLYASERLGVGIGEILLVAAHDWDVSGAIHAGAKAAFVGRNGVAMSSLLQPPDIVGPDLVAVAKSIIHS